MEEDFAVQPNSLVNGLISKLEAEGVVIRTGSPVLGLKTSRNKAVAVRTPWERLEADHVVISAGAWSGSIAKMAGVNLPIESGKGYGLDFKSATNMPKRAISLKNAQIAVSPLDEGLRLGGTMEISGINDNISARRVAAIERGGNQALHGIPENQKPDLVWAGMRPMAPDGLPVMGSLPGFTNLSVASGHSMLGLTLTPATGGYMAELIATGKPPDVIKPFSAESFRGIP